MTRAGRILGTFSIVLGTAFGQTKCEWKLHVPLVSCWEPSKANGFPDESVRSKILTSPDGNQRTYTQVEAHYDPHFEEPCRTHATLLVSSGQSSFRIVYQQRTSKDDLWSVTLGPVAWSPNSRWLVVEELYDHTGSDAGGLDLLLFDAEHHTTRREELYQAIRTKLDKACDIDFPRFRAFDRHNRLILQVWERVDPGSEPTNCLNSGELWVFDPVSGHAKRVGRR